MASFSDNRCKFCDERDVFYCPVKKRTVEPGDEVFDCDAFVGRDRGLSPEEKKRGSLGSGCNCRK